VKARGRGIAGLRLATAALAIAAGGLVIWQKHLLARPVPGLVLVLACVLPFAADARCPRLFRSPCPGAAAVLLVLGSATALLAYRPAAGDAAVLFFIVLAARAAAGAPPAFSVPAGVLAVILPEVVNLAGPSRTPAAAAIGTAFAWVAGAAMRGQARLTADLVAMQAAAAGHEIAAERQQLAREFHDLVAHTLSVTMLHMTAVRLSLDDGEVGEALESLAEAQRAGREAMREMRQTVGLLGSPAPAGTETALPQASDLPELVAGYASAGLRVALDVQGDLAAVSGDTGLAVYRIAQESLANAAKHAPGSAAQVSVLVTRAELSLSVTNDICSPAPLPATGHGIPGMAQRAALLGGTFSAGPPAAGSRQWRVQAALPLADR
jgi:signal transduction histidine kinase